MKEIVPAGVELDAIESLASLDGLRILEIGCGEGRLTNEIARRAARVLATDPEAEYVAAARRGLPGELRARVQFRVAAAEQLDAGRAEYDLALFSWSL